MFELCADLRRLWAVLVLQAAFWGIECVTQVSAQEYAPAIAPASNEGELALQGFRLPDGVHGELVAAEPVLANPVAFCIDEQGRFYIAETFRQQKGVEDNRGHMSWLHDDLALQSVAQRVEMFRKHLGEKVYDYTKEHDRIRMLTDTDGDGRIDSATVFADGFNAIEDGTGAGLLARQGQVFYTCIPKLWKLTDTNGDGHADEKQALHDGYGVRVAFRGHDMHGLVMGPDGRVYYSIGDRGYNVTTDDGRQLVRPDTGAVFRCELDGSRVEVFAYGLRNPQELAFDDFGNLFTCDNNSDSGDQARWMHVVEGSDTGWRMYYQYLSDRGPWNREKLWHPQHVGQPAHIVPPVINISDGPSGLVYYPGVGLPDRYKGHFFLCDFRGGPSNSGIRSFGIKPKGATFELTDAHEFLWKILGTDVDFGYDGSLYVTDWVNGWDGLGKGRLYRFTHAEAAKTPMVASRIMREGFADRSLQDLVGLMAHPDRRVRQEAQFEAAARGAAGDGTGEAVTGLLADVVGNREQTQVQRLHALWAIGQIARQRPQTASHIVVHCADSDPIIRAQVVKLVADLLGPLSIELSRTADALSPQALSEPLANAVTDDDPQTRYFAAIALGRDGDAKSVSSLLKLLDANKDDDPVIRHGAVLGLEAIGRQHPGALERAAKHPSAHGRLGVLLAMRRLRDPAVAQFLSAPESSLIVEAARAIHDEPIPEAMPALAALASQPLASQQPEWVDSLVRRVMNAAFRSGTQQDAERVAAYAADPELAESLRLEALEELRQWDDPSPVDRVLGDWRPLEKRNAEFVASVLRPRLGALLSGSEKLRKPAVELAAKYGIHEIEPALFAIAKNVEQSPEARVAALKALEQFRSKELAGLVSSLGGDGSALVRLAVLEARVRLQPAQAVKLLATAARSAPTTLEQQGAIRGLAGLKDPEADAVLLELLATVIDGTAAAGVQLDILEAARGRQGDSRSLATEVARYEASLPADNPFAKYAVTQEGGDARRGQDIFFGRSAASCRRCHLVQGSGGVVGPDLSGIGLKQKRDYIVESIVNPNAKIAKGFETMIVITRQGRPYAGIVKASDDTGMKLMLADGSVVAIPKDDIDETARGQSAMPADLIKHLSLSDVRDLVEYLAVQQTPPPGDEPE